MAFQFPKDNEPRYIRTGRTIVNQAKAFDPIYKVQEQRKKFNGNGRWGMVIYYYFLEKLLTRLRKDLKFIENEWTTSIWEEASKLVEEPEDIIEGLKKLQPICQKGCEEVLEDLANSIQLLTAIKAFEEK